MCIYTCTYVHTYLSIYKYTYIFILTRNPSPPKHTSTQVHLKKNVSVISLSPSFSFYRVPRFFLSLHRETENHRERKRISEGTRERARGRERDIGGVCAHARAHSSPLSLTHACLSLHRYIHTNTHTFKGEPRRRGICTAGLHIIKQTQIRSSPPPSNHHHR